MRRRRLWTLFIITDTGRAVPHWSAYSRHEVRTYRSGMTIPKGVKTRIRKVWEGE